jgi:hypothetical protein
MERTSTVEQNEHRLCFRRPARFCFENAGTMTPMRDRSACTPELARQPCRASTYSRAPVELCARGATFGTDRHSSTRGSANSGHRSFRRRWLYASNSCAAAWPLMGYTHTTRTSTYAHTRTHARTHARDMRLGTQMCATNLKTVLLQRYAQECGGIERGVHSELCAP